MFKVFGRTGLPIFFGGGKSLIRFQFSTYCIADHVTKDPEMLQPNVFCKHAVKQNLTNPWLAVALVRKDKGSQYSKQVKQFLNCTKFGQLILRKIIKIVVTRSHILKIERTKFDFG